MEPAGRNLRSGLTVAPIRSPQKASNTSTKKKSGKNSGKGAGKAKNGGSKSAPAVNSNLATVQAKAFVEEYPEVEVEEVGTGKRRRDEEEEGELLTTAEIAEANSRAAEAMKDDEYVRVVEGRIRKAIEDVQRYRSKMTLAKDTLEGLELASKLEEINKKLTHLEKLQIALKNLIPRRQDQIFKAALQEISDLKHTEKRHCIAEEASKQDDLVVSDG